MKKSELKNIIREEIKIICESSKYEIYHSSYTSAVTEAMKYAAKNGYEVDEDSWFREITTGPGKPKSGKTVKHHIDLINVSTGKIPNKKLAIQVYNRNEGSKPYELNCYIQ